MILIINIHNKGKRKYELDSEDYESNRGGNNNGYVEALTITDIQ